MTGVWALGLQWWLPFAAVLAGVAIPKLARVLVLGAVWALAWKGRAG